MALGCCGIVNFCQWPAMTLGTEALPVQYEASVSPLKGERVIWRLRRITGSEHVTGAADMRALYVEDAPMGFFSSGPDGTISYANAWLRESLGLSESAKNIRLDDIMRGSQNASVPLAATRISYNTPDLTHH